MYVHTQIKQEAINGKFGHSLVFVTHFLLVVSDATCKVWTNRTRGHWFWTLNNATLVQCLWLLISLGLYSMAPKQFSPLLGCVASEQFNPLSLHIWRLIIHSHRSPKSWKQVVTVAWQQLDGICHGDPRMAVNQSPVSHWVLQAKEPLLLNSIRR